MLLTTTLGCDGTETAKNSDEPEKVTPAPEAAELKADEATVPARQTTRTLPPPPAPPNEQPGSLAEVSTSAKTKAKAKAKAGVNPKDRAPSAAQIAAWGRREETNNKPARDLVIEMPTTYEEVTGVSCPGLTDPTSLLVDGTVLFQGYRGKVLKSCTGDEWESTGFSSGPWGSDFSGNIYVSWTRQEPTTRTQEIVISKLDPAGKLLWQESVSTGHTNTTPTFLVASPAGVYVGGTTGGQLPGNPPDAKGGAWLVRYSSGGELGWTRQEQPNSTKSNIIGQKAFEHTNSVSSAAIDGNDNLYLLYDRYGSHGTPIRKLDSRGDQKWIAFHSGSRCRGKLQVSSEGDSMFYGGGHENGACVTKLDANGEIVWSNTYTPRHSVVIDEIEGTRWKGQAGRGYGQSSARLTFSEHSLMLVGAYSNSFEHGSSPPPPFVSAWVATLDLDGEIVSARHLRVGPLDEQPGETGSRVSFSPSNAIQLPNGDLRIVGTRTGGSKHHNAIVTVPTERSQRAKEPSEPTTAPSEPAAAPNPSSAKPSTEPSASGARPSAEPSAPAKKSGVLSSMWNKLAD